MTTEMRGRVAAGYSLIELLVVLVIVGVLAVVGTNMMIGNRQSGAVRSLLDELEGALSNAHKVSVATGSDVAIVTWGTWDAATPMTLAYGNANLDQPLPPAPADPTAIQNIALNLLKSIPPAPGLGQAAQTVAVPFHYLPKDPSQMRARIVALTSDQWANVKQSTGAGKTNQLITDVEPFKSAGPLKDVLTDDNNLFSFSSTLKRCVISGSNKRFNTAIVIPVVGTSTGGGAVPGGPMGLIVVLANGGTIYKFYNPGCRDSDGQWRKI